MRLDKIVNELQLEALTPLAETEVTGGYASDLLSDVLANGREGNIWVTIQVNRNVAAVASLKEFAGVVLAGGRHPQEDLLEVARREGVCLLSTAMGTYEVCGRLFALGIPPAQE
ncbi:MAG: DRTGG domain-containing protein [Armatimonadota bacterium]|jgi:hypothetical protein|nr:DRTGG domain-containing protein [Armatimonadota bacterium]